MQFWTTDDDVSRRIFLGLKVDILRYTMEAKLNLPFFFYFVIFWVWSALENIRRLYVILYVILCKLRYNDAFSTEINR